MQLEQQVDKILSVVLDNQAKLGDLDERITRIEEAQAGTFERLDEFIGLMKHQNMELATRGSKYQRLEERIAVLESR
ncbi:MAG: hypothetical protein NUV84_00110 [Candidatus Uhrbacteria bacterium]|nr:hypothetical protein [Candidatus Uhrbacteria bacterium]